MIHKLFIVFAGTKVYNLGAKVKSYSADDDNDGDDDVVVVVDDDDDDDVVYIQLIKVIFNAIIITIFIAKNHES